jgi:hypothetical protein
MSSFSCGLIPVYISIQLISPLNVVTQLPKPNKDLSALLVTEEGTIKDMLTTEAVGEEIRNLMTIGEGGKEIQDMVVIEADFKGGRVIKDGFLGEEAEGEEGSKGMEVETLGTNNTINPLQSNQRKRRKSLFPASLW